VERLKIGLIGTRFAGLDGVTLESIKVARVLESLGHEVSWFGGLLDPEFSPGVEVPDAMFDAEANLELNSQIYGTDTCAPVVLDEIERSAAKLQRHIADFVAGQQIDLLMPQNSLAIPMHVPLGLAIARLIRDNGVPAIAHHHDFAWERNRFWPNAVGALLDEAFPPTAPNLGHLVINSLARNELRNRTRAEARLLPNIMDFTNAPPPGDGAAFRSACGLSASDRLVLQPTRMVPRKGIEDTLELARLLGDPGVRVVVTHPEPDEGMAYIEYLTRTADEFGVDFRIVPAGPGTSLGLADAYAAADLVAYPSRIEGFGNALLEAFYFKRPLLVNRYPVYAADIGPLGVHAIEMDGQITEEVVALAGRWLADPTEWSGAVEANYGIGRRYFSYEVAADVIKGSLSDIGLV